MEVPTCAIFDLASRAPTRNLDHYIEAQVHGGLALKRDVEILVADPSFQQTETGETLERLCERYEIRLFWHAGFCVQVGEVPVDFRGPAMPSLARRIAEAGLINARIIGEAAASLKRDASGWQDRGCYEEVLQELKQLWHVLVQYGRPIADVG